MWALRSGRRLDLEQSPQRFGDQAAANSRVDMVYRHLHRISGPLAKLPNTPKPRTLTYKDRVRQKSTRSGTSTVSGPAHGLNGTFPHAAGVNQENPMAHVCSNSSFAAVFASDRHIPH